MVDWVLVGEEVEKIGGIRMEGWKKKVYEQGAYF